MRAQLYTIAALCSSAAFQGAAPVSRAARSSAVTMETKADLEALAVAVSSASRSAA